MVKVKSVVKQEAKQKMLDIEVDSTHTYVIKVGSHKIITHNTVSLLAGSTPGIHYPISQYYIRRVRIANDSILIAPLKEAGYNVVPCIGSEKTTLVVEFPVNVNNDEIDLEIKSTNEVSIEEKFELSALIQKHWSDNQVSVTIDFDPNTEGGKIKYLLKEYSDKLKSVSFLPRFAGVYQQMPYEEISKETYFHLVEKIKPLNFAGLTMNKNDEKETDQYCDGEQCMRK